MKKYTWNIYCAGSCHTYTTPYDSLTSNDSVCVCVLLGKWFVWSSCTTFRVVFRENTTKLKCWNENWNRCQKEMKYCCVVVVARILRTNTEVVCVVNKAGKLYFHKKCIYDAYLDMKNICLKSLHMMFSSHMYEKWSAMHLFTGMGTSQMAVYV